VERWNEFEGGFGDGLTMQLCLVSWLQSQPYPSHWFQRKKLPLSK